MERPAAAVEVGNIRAGSAPMPGKLTVTTSPGKPAVKDASYDGPDNSASTTITTAGNGSSSGDVESVGVGTAEIASTATAAGAGAGVGTSDAGGTGGLFRFFQSCDGQKAFLHPLNMRQLLDDSEKGLPLPERIDAKVR